MDFYKYFTEANLNTGLNAFEKLLNVADWFPSKSKIHENGAQMRLGLGVVLVVTSLATSAISLIVGLIKKDWSEGCKELAKRSLTYLAHGFLNLIRYNLSSGGWNSVLAVYDIARNEFLAYKNIIPGFDITSRAFDWIKVSFGDLKYSDVIPKFLDRLSKFAA